MVFAAICFFSISGNRKRYSISLPGRPRKIKRITSGAFLLTGKMLYLKGRHLLRPSDYGGQASHLRAQNAHNARQLK